MTLFKADANPSWQPDPKAKKKRRGHERAVSVEDTRALENCLAEMQPSPKLSEADRQRLLQDDRKPLHAERQRRADYVNCIRDFGLSTEALSVAISEVAFRRQEFPPPSLITVRRWLCLCDQSGDFEAASQISRSVREASKGNANELNRFYED